MQPTLTQVPPNWPDSATPTLAPSAAETRLALTPPEPPPMVKRSKSNARTLLQVLEIHLHEVEQRGDVAVLLAREPFLRVVHTLLDLRLRHAFDAGEHAGQIGESLALRHAAHLPEPRLDFGALEVGDQLHRLVVGHGAFSSLLLWGKYI